ncbi:hypothetical protein DL95DRAFT_449718 [Leptodontidium sp. 2 PMI_412]|nr:hypothetical protein BKA61DRAFT_48216 [Leptodontidium sp. MPI-SDFR-AT-0119]KAH9208687.1 hypothetical protein DL95DRAFT_449718 [Leptodontidium sp. 2 PMI_412]
MPRPSFYTRSKTAPQLPPLSDISPISPITLPFTDPFSPTSKIPHHQNQNQHQTQTQNLTHHLTRSTSCPSSPQPQKRLSWSLRRASLATKSLTHLPLQLPLPIIRPTHILQSLRSSFSSLVSKREEHNHNHQQKKEREQKQRNDSEEENEDVWGREWEVGYESRRGDGESEEEEEFERGFCLHLPPEVSMDKSEIEYLRRLEREALSARIVGVMA